MSNKPQFPGRPTVATTTVNKTEFPFPAGHGSKKQRPQRPSVQVSNLDQAPPPESQQRPAAPPAAQNQFAYQQQAVPEPPPPQSAVDPAYAPIDLPSGFIFYPFKQLSVAQIRGKHQAKFALAFKRQSLKITVEAISSLLGDGVQAQNLTICDFYAVMYWLRLNCMGKLTFPITANCSDPQHVLDVVEKKKNPKTLKNYELISKTDLKQTDLDPEKVKAFMEQDVVKELEALGFTLTGPTIADTIDLEDNWSEKPEYADIEFLTDFAGSIKSTDPTVKLTLSQRIEIVGELEARFIGMLREWQDIVQGYGIEESVSLRCKECGAKIETQVSISAHDFL